MLVKNSLALLSIILALPFCANAADETKHEFDSKWTYSLTWENDYFSQSDDNYTNGARISAVSPEISNKHWIEKITDYTPFFNHKGRKRVTYALGQTMYTPEDVFATQLVPDQRPYGGFLFGSVGMVSDTGKMLERFNLTLGVIGPSSRAFETQRDVHKARDILVPRGWDNQLKDEPGIIIGYEKVRKKYLDFGFMGFGADVMPKLGFNLGNVHTYGAAGATFRLGRDLPADYGVPKIRPRMAGSEYFVPTKDLGFYFFADFEGRAVLRDIFLDGSTFRNSHSVDKYPLVGDAQFGAAITYKDVRIAYTHIYRTKEFQQQTGGFEPFGALTLSFRY